MALGGADSIALVLGRRTLVVRLGGMRHVMAAMVADRWPLSGNARSVSKCAGGCSFRVPSDHSLEPRVVRPRRKPRAESRASCRRSRRRPRHRVGALVSFPANARAYRGSQAGCRSYGAQLVSEPWRGARGRGTAWCPAECRRSGARRRKVGSGGARPLDCSESLANVLRSTCGRGGAALDRSAGSTVETRLGGGARVS